MFVVCIYIHTYIICTVHSFQVILALYICCQQKKHPSVPPITEDPLSSDADKNDHVSYLCAYNSRDF